MATDTHEDLRPSGDVVEAEVAQGWRHGGVAGGPAGPGDAAMTTILGIDPGATGAIAMVCPTVDVWDMPATPHDLATLMRTFDPATTRVYVEEVHAMPKNGSIASFKLGQNFGGLLATLAVLQFPYILVSPSKWKPAMGLKGADKAESRRKAQELYPTAALSRVKDHGRAEALLLATWGQQR